MESFIQAGGGIDVVIDETLERRWGAKISKRGHYRDSAPSSRERSVSSPGLRWIVMAVVVTLPWTQQRWALPFLCVPATTPEVSEKLGKRHKTVGMRAHQMVSLLRRWLPNVPIKLMGDTAYSILELELHCVAQQMTLIAPFRLDSVIRLDIHYDYDKRFAHHHTLEWWRGCRGRWPGREPQQTRVTWPLRRSAWAVSSERRSVDRRCRSRRRGWGRSDLD